MTRTFIAAHLLGAGRGQEFVGAAAAAAGDRDDLGGGDLGAACAFAGDQRPHLLAYVRCGRWVLVRARCAVLRQRERGRGTVAVGACEVKGAGGRAGHLGHPLLLGGLADGTTAPLPGPFGGLLVAAAAELVPTVRAGGDPHAMQQVQGEGRGG
jgi:hypothetical protein